MTFTADPVPRAPRTAARRGPALLTAVAVVVALVAGCSESSPQAPATALQDASSAPAASPAATTPGAAPADAFTRDADGAVTGLTYPGQDGRTALELLLAADPSAKVQGSGANAFVVGIGGRIADDGKHEFWSLEVDGTQAQVGAGTLKTKDGETITWTLATY